MVIELSKNFLERTRAGEHTGLTAKKPGSDRTKIASTQKNQETVKT